MYPLLHAYLQAMQTQELAIIYRTGAEPTLKHVRDKAHFVDFSLARVCDSGIELLILIFSLDFLTYSAH